MSLGGEQVELCGRSPEAGGGVASTGPVSSLVTPGGTVGLGTSEEGGTSSRTVSEWPWRRSSSSSAVGI